MPRFVQTPIVSTPQLTVNRTVCDGCDGARPVEEHTCGAQLWLPVSGRFVLRDADGRHALDPATGVVLPRAHPFTVRHPDGPDVVLSFSGPWVEQWLAERPGFRTFLPDARVHAALLTQVASARSEPRDDLGLAEPLCALEPPTVDGVRPTERELAEALQDELRLRPSEPMPLAELAGAVGVSVFHACRTFRRVTGTTLQAYRRDVRLRHALALVLDGGVPLGEVAARTGFASQSHLTNRFRERFGVAPGAMRRRAR